MIEITDGFTSISAGADSLEELMHACAPMLTLVAGAAAVDPFLP